MQTLSAAVPNGKELFLDSSSENSSNVMEKQPIRLARDDQGNVQALENLCCQVRGLSFLISRRLGKGKPDEVAAGYIEMFGDAVERISQLCKEVFRLGSSEGMTSEKVLPEKVVKEIVEIAAVVLKGVVIETKDLSGDRKVDVNDFGLQQTLLNLIWNAQQSNQWWNTGVAGTSAEKKVTITIHPLRRRADENIRQYFGNEACVCISVGGTSIGTNKDIVGPPFVERSSLKDTGIGLLRSALLARLCGGALFIRSMHGAITNRMVCLPAAS
ncbi:MAG: hypothetical protein K9M10_03750 [Candidatus Pacebacteria bacterium]|nr:hypothetical protein [Candidatus Paceibacterota bacterium]MCF7857566.1 hypothetical protein [Candidatus Paceibacterota bacterium]